MTSAGIEDVLRFIKPSAPWKLTVKGRSMHPTLKPGDRILVDPHAKPSVGDVIVFVHHRQLVVHRLIETGRVFVTAGDASRGQTERIARNDVLGVAIGHRSRRKSTMLRLRIGIRYHLRMRH
jgi:SOS-response transcriptional repressor LexA